MALRVTNPDSWSSLSAIERVAMIAILVLVVAQAITVVTAVQVDGPTVKGGFLPRLLAMLVNYEDDRTHIVSPPLLWVARGLLVALIATVVISVRARRARLRSGA